LRLPGNERAAEAKLRILTVPGLGGSGPAHWQTRWEVRHGDGRVGQRDWDRPDLDLWLAALTAALAAADQPVVLAAHSLGAVLVAHAARRGLTGPVRGALLVAPADVDDPACTPPETRGFSPVPLAPLPFPATIVASQNDPYVAFDRARAFAAAWGATFVDAGPRGHLNADSGLGDWSEGRALLTALLPR
jgi:predicted alpha/beta hydrolase family esterase